MSSLTAAISTWCRRATIHSWWGGRCSDARGGSKCSPTTADSTLNGSQPAAESTTTDSAALQPRKLTRLKAQSLRRVCNLYKQIYAKNSLLTMWSTISYSPRNLIYSTVCNGIVNRRRLVFLTRCLWLFTWRSESRTTRISASMNPSNTLAVSISNLNLTDKRSATCTKNY